MTARTLALAVLALGVVAPSAVRASEREVTPDPSSLPQPTPPGTPGTTTVVSPPGSGGVTVVVPGPNGGQVTASGCSTVVVQGQPTVVGPGGAPCPTLAPYQPYQPYQPYYPPPPAYEARPRYARDPDRTGALIGASVGFGLGTAIAGLYYLVAWDQEKDHCGKQQWNGAVDNSRCGGARASLITYGAIVTFVPSIPRFVVGDGTKGLIYSALRGVSVTSAALIDWGDKADTKWQGPFLLGFAAPLTLGIIDLATTPHREDLERKAAKAGVTNVSPVAIGDGHGRVSGGMLAMGGLF